MIEQRLAEFIRANEGDLMALGLFFCRLLQADFHVLDARPSPVLAAVLSLDQKNALGTAKSVERLIEEFDASGADILTDGSGGSILRL